MTQIGNFWLTPWYSILRKKTKINLTILPTKQILHFTNGNYHISINWITKKETANSKSSFIFDYLLYKQVDGVALGFPLGPFLANAFLCHYEKEWLDNCPIHFKPMIYQRYVYDIFFSFKEHLQLFVSDMNKQHKFLKFTSEAENFNSLVSRH